MTIYLLVEFVMKNDKKRLYTYFGIAILLLTALVFGRQFFRKSESIGDFQVPTLAGWDQKITRSERLHIVKYEKKDTDTRLYIGLSWKRNRVVNPPKNVQDLLDEVTEGEAIMGRRANALGTSITNSQLRTMTINGMPAVLSNSIMKGESRTTYIRSVSFINGKNFYDLVSNIKVPPTSAPNPPADLQREMDQAIAEIEKSLKPTS